YSLIAGLRAHLPRHRIIGLLVGATVHPHEIASIVELVADGALPVVRAVPVTTTLQPVGWSRSKESTGWSGGCELVDEVGDGVERLVARGVRWSGGAVVAFDLDQAGPGGRHRVGDGGQRVFALVGERGPLSGEELEGAVDPDADDHRERDR